MANETIIAKGSYATIQATANISDNVLSAGTVTPIGTAIPSEALYPLLDLKLTVSTGTPVAGGTIDVYRRPSDGTNQSPLPVVGDFLTTYVGSFILDNALPTQYYYLYGIANPDPNDTYYMYNNDGATLSITLAARGRTYGTA